MVEGAALDRPLQTEDRYQRRVITYYDAGILQPDEGDEQPDTNGYRCLQRIRDHVEDRFPDIHQRKNDEDDTFHEDGCQSGLPAVPHPDNDGIGKESIQPHTGGEDEGQVGDKAHQEGCDGGSQRSRCEDRARVHSGSAQQ